MLTTNHNITALFDEYCKLIHDLYVVCRMDTTGTILTVNANLCTLSEYTEAELIGQNYSVLHHPDSGEESFKSIWKQLQEGERWSGILKHRAKSGKLYVTDAIISPLIAPDGTLEGCISFQTDVTKLHEEQHELLRQRIDATLRAHYEDILASIPIPAAILDAHSNVELTNNAFAKLFNPPEGEAINLDHYFVKREGYLGKDTLFDWKEYPFKEQGDVSGQALFSIDGKERAFMVNVKHLSEDNCYLTCLTLIA